jgi:hypothetical protein
LNKSYSKFDLFQITLNRAQRLSLHEPFGQEDIREIFGGNGTRKRNSRPSGIDAESSFPVISRFHFPSQLILDDYKMTSVVREILNIPSAIRVEDIPKTLSKFQASKKRSISEARIRELYKLEGWEVPKDIHDIEMADGDLLFSYPTARYTLSPNHDEWLKFFEGFPTYEIEQIKLNANEHADLITFKELVDGQSAEYGIHPALVLAFYLCDIDIRNDITILSMGRYFNLILPSFPVTDKEIRLAHSQIRNMSQMPPTHKTGPSDRVKQLIAFRQKHSGLSWDDFLKKWNKDNQGLHPDWKYKNVASIQVVLSRVAKMRKRPADNVMQDIRVKVSDFYDLQNSLYHTSPFHNEGWNLLTDEVKNRFSQGIATDADVDVLEEANYRAEHPGWDKLPQKIKERLIKGADYCEEYDADAYDADWNSLEEADRRAGGKP